MGLYAAILGAVTVRSGAGWRTFPVLVTIHFAWGAGLVLGLGETGARTRLRDVLGPTFRRRDSGSRFRGILDLVSVFGEERQGTARYLQALAQHWPFIAGSVALALVAALLYLSAADERYDAHADLLVTPVAINDTTFVGLPVIRESGEGRGVLTAARLGGDAPGGGQRAQAASSARDARAALRRRSRRAAAAEQHRHDHR